MTMKNDYDKAAEWIAGAKRAVAFTGAGISVESGIPTFRGPEGLWSCYAPQILDLGYFHRHPLESWRAIKEIFYDYMGSKARPNAAHRFLAELERLGILRGVITQNIDNLHQEAGSRKVVEFHGTAQRLECTSCRKKWEFEERMLEKLPPACPDSGGLLKPDFIFFGEAIPPDAYRESVELCHDADLLIIVGTTGEVMPASMIPFEVQGAKVIEINVEPSRYTEDLTDIFLEDRATVAARKLEEALREKGVGNFSKEREA
jgi:NAD-dependent deacetylase